ncbi:hypothetical protein M671_11910, partial [Neisseria gonorrhoeae CH811]
MFIIKQTTCRNHAAKRKIPDTAKQIPDTAKQIPDTAK